VSAKSGHAGTAIAGVAQLDRLAMPPSEVLARLLPEPRCELQTIVEQRTARGRYAVLLDPFGSVPFRPGKPRRWLATAPLEGWPARAFAVELELCPMRGNSETTLFSYANPAGQPFVLCERAEGGLTIELGGESVSSGIHLDYAQWQRIAVAWDERTATVRLYKDDGPARVTAEAEGRSPAPLGAPVFERALTVDAALAAGGTLVLGQRQRRSGVIGDFPLDRSFLGAVAELRVWRGLPDFSSPELRVPDEGESALVGRWRFSALGLELGEAVATILSPAALIGGFAPGELRDVRRARLLVTDGRVAVASGPLIAMGREHRLEVSLRDGLAVRLDGRTLQCSRIEPTDVLRGDRRGLRVGVPGLVSELRLSGADGRTLAHYRRDPSNERIAEDLSGNGLDLVTES
jgi:hypothetical protein